MSHWGQVHLWHISSYWDTQGTVPMTSENRQKVYISNSICKKVEPNIIREFSQIMFVIRRVCINYN